MSNDLTAGWYLVGMNPRFRKPSSRLLLRAQERACTWHLGRVQACPARLKPEELEMDKTRIPRGRIGKILMTKTNLDTQSTRLTLHLSSPRWRPRLLVLRRQNNLKGILLLRLPPLQASPNRGLHIAVLRDADHLKLERSLS